jgi:hypothetical protein
MSYRRYAASRMFSYHRPGVALRFTPGYSQVAAPRLHVKLIL